MEEKILETTLQTEATQSEPVQFSEKELQVINDISAKIDITDTQAVLQYGAAAQTGIAEFSETALGNARGKNLGVVGGMIGELMAELRGFDAGEAQKGGFFGLFRRAGRRLEVLRAKYQKASASVANIAEKMESHQLALMKDLEILEQMGAELVYFSPVNDRALPEKVGGIYLGGGYPETYRKQLSENEEMKKSIREAAACGKPVFAECGGFMYVCDNLVETDESSMPMLGLIHTDVKMTTRLSMDFGYVTLTGTCEHGQTDSCDVVVYDPNSDTVPVFYLEAPEDSEVRWMENVEVIIQIISQIMTVP